MAAETLKSKADTFSTTAYSLMSVLCKSLPGVVSSSLLCPASLMVL